MALPPTFRFRMKNGTGQAVGAEDAVLTVRYWKNGGRTWSPGAVTIANKSAIANTEFDDEAEAVVIQNVSSGSTRSLWEGLYGQFTVTGHADASGDVDLLVEHSLDGGTTWQSSIPDSPLASATLADDTPVTVNFKWSD